MKLYRFASFWIYPLLACLLVPLSRFGEGAQWVSLLWLVPIGLFSWTVLEYILHRFIFHWSSQNLKVRQILQALHLNHHGDPQDPEKILVRPVFSLSVSTLILILLAALTQSIFVAAGVLVGIWTGFLYYESVHYRLHVSKSGNGLLRHQRGWHFYHHFIDEHCCFGVTSPLWDLVFGTYSRIKRPRDQRLP